MKKKALGSMLVGTAIACAAGLAGAQTVYRIVGPDGRVTFSDRAPTSDTPSQSVTTGAVTEPAGTRTSDLPLEVKQAATKYPLTFYTSKDCGACDVARRYLLTRGVPFAEKTVTSNAEIQALRKLNPDGTIPFATLGSQHLSGFNENDWSAYLDAAGYPAQSKLPSSYRPAPAQPLIPKVIAPAAPSAAQPADGSAEPAPGNQSVEPDRVTPSNPTGIVF